MEELIKRAHLAKEFQISKEIQGEGIPKVYRLHNHNKHNYLFINTIIKKKFI